MEAIRWGRERSFGQLFSAAFSMASAHRRWLVPLVVTVSAPQLALMVAGQGYALRDPERLAHMISRGDWDVLYDLAGTLAVFGAVWLVLAIACSLFLHSALYGALAAAGRGEPLSLGMAYREGLRRF